MGACGSIPKAMRSGVDIGEAPPPKEETSATVRATDKDLVMKVEQGEEKKPQGGDDFAKPEDDKNKDGDRQSLESLLEMSGYHMARPRGIMLALKNFSSVNIITLTHSEEVKELPKTEKIISPETQTIVEEQKSEALPASDKASEEQAEKDVTPYVAPVARATEEDKET